MNNHRASMGSAGEFYNELNRLKKELLIEIIINKSVPTSITVSKELRRLIDGRGDEVLEAADEETKSNLNTDVRVIQLKSDIKVLESELKCARVVVSTMEKTIGDKEVIIDLLRKQGKGSFMTNSVEAETSVAGCTQKTQNNGNRVALGRDLGYRKPMKDKAQKPPPTKSTGPEQAIKRKTNVVIGSGEKSGEAGKLTFAGAVRRAWLYVGRAEVNTSPQQVLDHLRGCFPDHNFDVEALPMRDDAKSVAFRIAADLTLIDELRRPEVWPAGIVVKRYRFFRKPSQISE